MDLHKGDLELSSSAAPAFSSDGRFFAVLRRGWPLPFQLFAFSHRGLKPQRKLSPMPPNAPASMRCTKDITVQRAARAAPLGNAGTCIGTYWVVSNLTGRVCSTFTDNEGPCGTNTCSGLSTAAPAAC